MMKKRMVLATLVALVCTSSIFAEEVNLGKEGYDATVNSKFGISIGMGDIGTEGNTIAGPIGIGHLHEVNAKLGIAIGYKATVENNAEQGIVIGTASYVGKLTKDEELGEVPQDTPTKVTNQSEVLEGNTLPLDKNKNPNETPTIPEGNENRVSYQAIAIGNHNRIYGFDAVGIGNGVRANGRDSISIGKASRAWLDNSIAMGSQAITAKKDSIAMGRAAVNLAEDGISIGTRSGISSKAENSVAIGSWARATQKNSVSLGIFSSTEGRGAAMDGTSAFSGETVKESHGVVSVGTEGYSMQFDNDTLNIPEVKRRIVNVAGGIKDTDAVNVKQLKAITNALGYTPEEIEKMNAGTGSKPESIVSQVHTVKAMAEEANDTAKIAGASAIALGALKALPYDGTDRTQVMAGVGQFKGTKGVALGIGHYTNKDRFYNFGLSLAGHTLSWNAGASFRIGKDEKKPMISNDYEMRIQQLEEKNAELEQKLNQLLVMQGK